MNDLEDTPKREKQRNIIHKYIDGPVEFMVKHNISPNLLSFIGFACSLTAAFLIGIGMVHAPIWFSWSVQVLMFFSGAFDVFDGEVARRTGKDSQAGAFLDSNLDRLSDAALVFGLIFSGLIDFLLGFVLLFLIIMISYTRARAENEGVDMKGVGIMERAERVILLMFILSIESWVHFLSRILTQNYILLLLSQYFFIVSILIFTGLLAFTFIQRFVFTFKNLKKNNI